MLRVAPCLQLFCPVPPPLRPCISKNLDMHSFPDSTNLLCEILLWPAPVRCLNTPRLTSQSSPLRGGPEVHTGSQGCTVCECCHLLDFLSLGTPAGEPVQIQAPWAPREQWWIMVSALVGYLHYCPQDPICYLEPSFRYNWDFLKLDAWEPNV